MKWKCLGRGSGRKTRVSEMGLLGREKMMPTFRQANQEYPWQITN